MEDAPRTSGSPRTGRASSSSASSSAIRCGRCGSTFARHEHLTRHIRTHTREKPFRCAVCGKSFSRQDVLTRHHASHHDEDGRQEPGPGPGPGGGAADVVVGSSRACRACAASRVRCSKGRPCRRCVQRDVECVYASGDGRRRTGSLSGVLGHPDASHGEIGTSPRANGADGTGLNVAGAGSQSILAPDTAGRHLPQDAASGPAPAIPSMDSGIPWMEARTQSLVAHALPPLNAAPDPSPMEIDGFYDFAASGNTYTDQAAGMLSVNWMSPDSQNDLNWDDQLAALSYSNVNFWGTFGMQLPPSGPAPPPQDHAQQSQLDVPAVPTPGRSVARQPLLAAGSPVGPDSRQPVSTPSAVGSTGSSSRTQGRFYVDGDAARAPFRGLSHQRGSVISPGVVLDDTGNGTTVGGEARSSRDPKGTPWSDKEMVSEHAYRNLRRQLQDLLPGNRADHPPRTMELPDTASQVPSHQYIRFLTRIYFERFHSVYPFLYKHPSLFEGGTGWILLLAVATVGAKYVQTSLNTQQSAGDLCRILQASLADRLHPTSQDDDGPWMPRSSELETSSQPDLAVVQAAILCQICLLHNGNDRLVKEASVQRFYLVDAGHNMQLFTAYEGPTEHDMGRQGNWVEREIRTRTGIMIWILDCIAEFEFGLRPLMVISDLRVPLPCHEDIWGRVELDLARKPQTCTVLEALEMMYMEKRLPPSLSEFGTTLLLLAIWRKNREVVREQRTELSAWVPQAKVQTRAPHTPDRDAVAETWPPASPLLSKWRNSACDSLDILHWSANSTVAIAGGWEHATVLLLHLSRLILLAPTEHMRDLAYLSSLQQGNGGGEGAASTNGRQASAAAAAASRTARYVKARNHLLQWAVRDQYKARLSIIHAGALFWHARRYSTNSFIEPFAIYTATLVAWAYSVATQFVGTSQMGEMASQGRPRNNPSGADAGARGSHPEGEATEQHQQQQQQRDASPTAAAEESESDPEPSFIHLDRPCDDELVQIYVRLGHKMPGYITGVGSICAPGAPAKILREGIRLLLGEPGHRRQHGSWAPAGGQVGGGRPAPPPLPPGQQHQQQQQREGASAYTWGIEPSYTRMLRSLIPETSPAAS